MSKRAKRSLLRAAAMLLCVGVPLAATLTQFPVWVVRSSEATVSGMFLMLSFLCALPFLKQIRAYFASPSAALVWGVLLVLLALLRNIIDEVIFVCAFGAPANILGMFLFKIADAAEKKDSEK